MICHIFRSLDRSCEDDSVNWRTKSLVQRCMAVLPNAVSNPVYFRLQRHFGGLRRGRLDPTNRLFTGLEFCRQIAKMGRTPRDAHFVEVGTGWRVNLPIACWLCGAERVTTLDLNRYLRFSLIREDLQYLAQHQDQLLSQVSGEYGDLFDVVRWRRLVDNPPTSFAELSELCGIDYRAPADARDTSLETHCADFHVSLNVFEHLPPDDLHGIVLEANRIIKPSGLLIHRVDHTDHFSHFDSELSPINFFRYSDTEWQRYAGHRFAYVNRLREDDYIALFGRCGQQVQHVESHPDPAVQDALEAEFPLAARFCGKSTDTLSRLTSLFVVSPQSACFLEREIA